jgi:hypothetical protein
MLQRFEIEDDRDRARSPSTAAIRHASYRTPTLHCHAARTRLIDILVASSLVKSR